MSHRLAVRVLAFLSLAGTGLGLAACGGGGGGGGGGSGGGGGPGIASIFPTSFSSEVATPTTVTGLGFGPAGAAVVRLTAASGTPFAGGTAAFLDVAATVVDDTTVTFTSPIVTITSGVSVGLSVRVTLASTTAYDSAGPITTLARPTFIVAAPPSAPLSTATPVVITGTGFGPTSGTVQVTFTAAAGTPFAGGTSATATATGTVGSTTSINVMSPAAATATAARIDLLFAGGSTAASGPAGFSFGSAVSTAPTITTSVSGDLLLANGDRVSFTVTISDADGDPVSLRLLNPPSGCTFAPIVAATSPKTATVEWLVDGTNEAGASALVFRGNDTHGNTKDLVVWTHLTPGVTRTMLVGDVTGDGKLDVVVAATNADSASAVNTGALYVWAGATTPSGTPTATLTVSGASNGDRLGSSGFRLVDVSGDGTLDVVAASTAVNSASGAIYLWKGGSGLTGSKNPDAVMSGAGGDFAQGPLSWLIGDVSGDGTADVVASAGRATAGASESGAVYVWKGGSGLSGSKSPDATLSATTPANGDQLGRSGIQLADLTGDGILDVFASSYNATVGGKAGAGALYVWNGGSGLTGAKSADATLTATGANTADGLGGSASQTPLVDVTGDGIADVVIGNPAASAGGVSHSGAIYVWKGGSTLTGAKTEDATLSVSGATADDHLYSGPYTRLLVGDVSGDGVPDIVGVASEANPGGVPDAGAACVWKGGSGLTGSKTQDATLTAASASSGDLLGYGGSRLADVTNDGVLDVVSSAPYAKANGITSSGAVYVWAGGSGLSGSVTATATLAVSGATSDDRLSGDPNVTRFTVRFADVSGDGALDLLVPASLANVTAGDEGAIYVWNGGSGLTGSPSPTATLTVSGAAPGDKLSNSSGAFVLAGDVTGDGVFDVISGAQFANVATGFTDVGALYVWKGGSGLTGAKTQDATLKDPTAGSFDMLSGGAASVGVLWDLYDVTGDGTRDVVVAVPSKTTTLSSAGTAYVWAGGSGLSGTPSPTATLAPPNPSNADRFGSSTGAGFDLLLGADLTGDGTVDLLIGASDYTGTGPGATGGVFLWKGGSGLTGTPATTSDFLVPGAAALDKLGS